MYYQYKPRVQAFNQYRNYRNHLNSLNNMRSIQNIGIPSIGKVITTPKSSGLFKSLLSSSAATSSVNKLGVSGIIGGISKTINTVNQAVPLINQVKPLFGNVKSVINVVKGFRNTKKEKTNSINTNIYNDLSISKKNIETPKQSKNIQENYQFTPNKPYFS